MSHYNTLKTVERGSHCFIFISRVCFSFQRSMMMRVTEVRGAGKHLDGVSVVAVWCIIMAFSRCACFLCIYEGGVEPRGL